MKKLIPLLITVALIIILFSQISLENFLNTISGISPFWVLVGLLCYSISYLFRAIRFRMLLGNKIALKEMYPLVCLHYLANNILPARLGELSYIYLVKKLHRIPAAEGIASLTIARVFDLIALSSLFLLSATFVEDIPAVIANSFMVMGVAMLLLVVSLILIIYSGQRFVDLLERIFNVLGIKKSRKIEFILTKSRETVDSFHVIKSKKVILYTLVNSFAIWFFLYMMNLSLLRGMGLNLSLALVILGSTFALLVSIVPVPSVANIGIYESAWALAFISLGMGKEIAIASGFAVHIIILLYVALLSGMAMYKIGRKNLGWFTGKI